MLLHRMKCEAIRVAKHVLRPSRRRTRPHALILLYHRIDQPRVDPWNLCVSRENFRAHLDVLRGLCEFVPLSAIPDLISAGRPQARTPVAITFDDGYLDNLTNALPELRAAGAPATIFLATGWIGRPQGFWWDRLAALVFDSGPLPRRIEVPFGNETFCWRSGLENERRARAALHRSLWQRCQVLPEEHREATLAALEACIPPLRRHEAARPMHPDEVREMHASGVMSIGAHTVTHRPMTALNAHEQETEIVRSREACRDLTGVTPTCFAYPYGEVAEISPRLVEKSGFSLACGTDEELVWPGRERFLLPRVSVGNLDAVRFERWLTRTWLR